MGIGIILIFWAIAGTICTGIGCAVMAGLATVAMRGVTKHRKKTILAATLFPVACFAWAIVLFFAQAVVNSVFLDRDIGMGDSWHAPLPNGDAILFIDLTEYGTVYNPKTQSDGGVGSQEDAVFGVRQMQVSGKYVLGAADTGWFGTHGGDVSKVDSYFILDTEKGAKQAFKSMDELKSAAKNLGITVNLEPIYNVYARYRSTWFDWLIGILFLGVPFIAFAMLVAWVWKLRRDAVMNPVVV